MSIAESLRGQVKGQYQAGRNVQDGISMLQLADGGLNTIHALLQRGRELAVQAANDTNTTADRTDIQAELTQLLREIDRAALTTTWNGIRLLGGSSYTATDFQNVQDYLQNTALGAAYDLVQSTWGIPVVGPNTRPLDIYLDEMGAGGVLAYVSGTGSFSPALELHVDMDDFVPGGGVGTPPMLNDRIIAHELTHAIMFDSTAFSSFPTWFQEGIAEFTHGADERVRGDLAAMGGDNAANRATLLNRISGSSWGGTSADYSAAYTTVRYLDSRLRANGFTNGLRDLTSGYMANNPGATIDGLVAQAGYANQAAFLADLKGGNGLAWMNASMSAANLTDADTGSATGVDYSGLVLDFNNVVGASPPGDPTPWIETFMPQAASDPVTLQEGANFGMTMDVTLVSASAGSLGVGSASVLSHGLAAQAISDFDAAIATVNGYRAGFAAQLNRLEHVANNLDISHEAQSAAESRIRDADMADQMASYTRQQIMLQSSTSMVAQANNRPFMILSLLG